MVGNLGAALSAVAFPYFVANVTIPLIAPQIDTASSFFTFAAVINILAMLAWLFMNPLRRLKEDIPRRVLIIRIVTFFLLVAAVMAALIYTKFFM